MTASGATTPLLPVSRSALVPVTVLCSGLASLGLLASENATGTDLQVLVLAAALVSPLAAAVLLDARPHDPVGLLLTVPGLLPVVALVVAASAEGAKPSAARAALEAPHLVVAGAALALVGLPLVVPGGWPRDRWGTVTGLAALAVATAGVATYLLRSDRQPDVLDAGLDGAERVALWALVPLGVSALVRLASLWRHSVGAPRQRAGWLLLGLLTTAPVMAVLAVADRALWTYLALGLLAAAPVALVWLLLTPSVPSLEPALLRAGLLITTTGVLVGGYLLARWTVGRTELPDSGAAAAVVTGLLALALLPFYVRMRDAGLVRLYGTARPGAAMGRLGRSLDTVDEVAEALAAAAEAVALAVRSPHAIVVLGPPPEDPGDGTCVVPLVAGSQPLGALVVAPRRAEEPFNRRDLELLELLSTPVAQLARAAVLTHELELARGDAVAQRLDERRRLRADLHDSVGPLLAGLGLHADAARRRHPDDPRLGAVSSAVAECRREVRRLVDELEPEDVPVADLEQSVRELVEGWASATVDTGLHLSVEVPEQLPPLPEAVRVAAYRVVGEALTNVVKHAGARQAVVRLVRDGSELVLEVRDDGRGPVPDGPRQGLGLRSMDERTTALGGELQLSGRTGGGTTLRARMPL
ncbi:MAG TPA: sensor histidine kinase [Mycobacteriales bacterium]|nr:sensor histidine kinase [Mycobacteriales bacterium]